MKREEREALGLALVFESDIDNNPDSYWCIEEDTDGQLYCTSNAETRQPVSPIAYRGTSAEEMRASLIESRVPIEVIERFLDQAF